MKISFGDGGRDQYIYLAMAIPQGYTVDLLRDGETAEDDNAKYGDVRLTFVDFEGAAFQFRRADGEPGLAHPDRTGCAGTSCAWAGDGGHRTGGKIPWVDLAEIHVY